MTAKSGLAEADSDNWWDTRDETECSSCGAHIGWCSEYGWTPFYVDSAGTVRLCEDCGE